MSDRLTLQQLRLKAKLSKPKLAGLAGLDYRTVGRAEKVNTPVFEMTAVKILYALQTHFERYPERAREIEIPKTIEEVQGLVIYQAALHKGRNESRAEDDEVPPLAYLIREYEAGVSAAEMEEEEREWDAMVSQPHVQVAMRRMAQETRRTMEAGETEEGGFSLEP